MKDISDTFYYSKMSDQTGNSQDGVEMSKERNSISRENVNNCYLLDNIFSQKILEKGKDFFLDFTKG